MVGTVALELLRVIIGDVEFVPLFLVVGVIVGGFRLVGPVLAVAGPIVFWTYLWISTGGDLYDDGTIGPQFWLFVMGSSVLMALLGVAAHRGVRRRVGR